jgi:cytoskeletal protein CcmA (bactofilin family)
MLAAEMFRWIQRQGTCCASAVIARHVAVLLILVVCLLHLSQPAAAQASAGREVTVTGEQSKQQFLAGDRVRILATVSDEVFAAGREIRVEGARAQSVYLVGGTILLKDSTVRDMIAGAHDVEVSGTIEDDALIAVCPVCPWGSGRLLVGPQGRIGDDAHLLAGTLEIQGTVGGNLRATARRIVISGSIAGNADLTAKEIVIASGARLAGELIARSPGKPEIAAGASISGPVREIQTEVNIPDPRDLPKVIAWIAAAVAVIVALGGLLLGVLAQLAAPGLLSQAAVRMRTELWGCIGRGLAWALILPAIGALLFVSLVGIPAAVILMATLLVLWALAFVTSAFAVGLWLRSRRVAKPLPEPRTGGRIGWTVVGTLVLLIGWMVPVVGWIFAALTLLGGLGAVATGLWRQTRNADGSAVHQLS